eukprot:GGOE01021607.1.p5 GENE.GGOE01021607.1~~GGOE01021607.1.p5  ORF type:complete len:108 (-),score=8.25 GGOE01021607.1:410-733(-)
MQGPLWTTWMVRKLMATLSPSLSPGVHKGSLVVAQHELQHLQQDPHLGLAGNQCEILAATLSAILAAILSVSLAATCLVILAVMTVMAHLEAVQERARARVAPTVLL